MEIYQSRQSLFEAGFLPEEIKRLENLRSARDQKEREKRQRLDFVRWLVSTGRLREDRIETNKE